MMIRTVIISILLFLVSGVSVAEIYKWLDEQGNIHFGDRPPPSQNAQTVDVRPNTYESVSIESFEAFKQGSGITANQVVMYSTSWCGVCKKAKQYFKANRIPYQEFDVEKNDKGRNDFAKLNGRGVPIILVGEQRMNGFSAQRFESMYKVVQ